MLFHTALFIVVPFFLPTVTGHGGTKQHKNTKLLIVSFDGFRWDYLKRTDTPNFDLMKKKGFIATYGLKNAFIAKTFPNHFTLVTGLWEESHGIVGNTMYDPSLRETFTIFNTSAVADSRWFDVGAEPIWVTNQLQKHDGRSGCVMWVGCEAPIKGTTPTRHIRYNKNMSNHSRIDALIEWFIGDYPINVGLLYFEEPDETAHKFGPDSPEVTKLIAEVDDVVGYLLQRMDEEGLLETTNLIITSDHGFAATSATRLVNLDDYISPYSYRIFSSNPVAAILPNEGMEESIYESLSSGAQKPDAHFKVYRKEEIPPQYHFTHNIRIMPILVVAQENYSIVFNGSQATFDLKGEHGYNNSLLDMHPFFLAMGPGFKPGSSVSSFNNVDVYPLMCHLLGLHPAPNNGSLDALLSVLVAKEEEETTLFTFGTYFFVLLIIASVGGVFTVAACRQHRYLKRMQRNRIISMPGMVKYSVPPVNGGAKVSLLSESSDEELHG